MNEINFIFPQKIRINEKMPKYIGYGFIKKWLGEMNDNILA
jgi:hypothetical protein